MRVELLEGERVHSIVGAFFAVFNYYGYGLSESVYAGALACELTDRGHVVTRELAVPVTYKGRRVAWQRLDLVVDSRVVVENKAKETLPQSAKAQLVSYLRATPFTAGVLLHYGPTPRFYRYVDWPKRVTGSPAGPSRREAATGRVDMIPAEDRSEPPGGLTSTMRHESGR